MPEPLVRCACGRCDVMIAPRNPSRPGRVRRFAPGHNTWASGQEAEQLALEAIKAGARSTGEVLTETGMSPARANEAMHRLLVRGDVMHPRHGTWEPAGTSKENGMAPRPPHGTRQGGTTPAAATRQKARAKRKTRR